MKHSLQILGSAMLLASLFGCGCSSYLDGLDSAQNQLEPVTYALEAYFRDHGRYPSKLSALVETGQLHSLPQLRESGGIRYWNAPLYDTDPNGTFYYLRAVCQDSVSYWHARYYISYEGQWKTGKYPPRIAELIEARAKPEPTSAPLQTNPRHFVSRIDLRVMLTLATR